ncbi:esterase YqiA [Pseudoalteromonas sp. MMG010]|uniref:YqiA/YcfP family alpha/beta fold hydrolase n=1 Tax=Pseudoalteromonas sp. MMG010 TaxID=2822685 RepID=UPI001B3A1A46|nr:YqiA/YcfP family alpha/beta fold hydrolase [Pseudoalteromonas sp. MMG010]MBQ4832836.1 esterase YqiA [Pseudoalteromonas sp. MMG010]
MVKRVIYIHGFNSSEKSFKAVRFGEVMANYDVEYYVPRLNHEPLAAIVAIEQLLTANTVLVGSSLGGFLATYLSQKHNVPAVLINPAVAPDKLLMQLLGENYNPYQAYHYQLTQRHIDALRMLTLTHLPRPELLMLLQQTGDEVLNFQHAVKYYSQCKQWVEFGGDHSFKDFDRAINKIVSFLKIN